MTDKKIVGSVTYQNADKDYFEKRGLKRHARVWSLWALGVGAVISGHFSGWNFGIAAGGWGGLFIAALRCASNIRRWRVSGSTARPALEPSPRFSSQASCACLHAAS